MNVAFSDQRNIMYSKTYNDDIYENKAFIWVKNRKNFIL